jgi:NAD(P)-dependent dehydrogenase (short-subunit alcohol dehydrogenase family)
MTLCRYTDKRDNEPTRGAHPPSMKTQNVLITGASQGLGRALAAALVARGHRVALVARRPEPLAAAVAELRAAGGVAHGIVADVGSPDAAARVVGEATAALGPLDVLIHNASTLGPVPLAPLLDLEPEEVEAVFQVNVLGPLRLTRLVAGAMALRGAGVILSISSDAAVEAYPTWGAYGASKAALDHAQRVLAEELRGRGVAVFAVDPGEMDTAMHRDALPDADPATLARPEAVAQAILRLLEPGVEAPTRTTAARLAEGVRP